MREAEGCLPYKCTVEYTRGESMEYTDYIPSVFLTGKKTAPLATRGAVYVRLTKPRGNGNFAGRRGRRPLQDHRICSGGTGFRALWKQYERRQYFCTASEGLRARIAKDSFPTPYFALLEISSNNLDLSSSRVITSVSPVLRERTATVFASTSLSPRTSI